MAEVTNIMSEAEKKVLAELKEALPALVNLKEVGEKFGATEKELRDAVKNLQGNLTTVETQCKALNDSFAETKKAAVLASMKEKGLGEEAILDLGQFAMNIVKNFKAPQTSFVEAIKAFQQKYETKTNALNITTSAEGGYLIPTPFADVINAQAIQASVFMQRASMLPITRGNALPNLTLLTDLTVGWTAESSMGSAIEPTFAESNTTLKKVSAYARMTNELIEDEEVGLISWMITRAGALMGEKVDYEGCQGDGTTFTGIPLTSGVNSVTMADGKDVTDFDADDLIDVECAMPVGHLGNSAYYLSLGALGLIKKFKDLQGRYIWMAPSGGQPGTINGYPYYVVAQGIPATDAGASKPVLFFGDLKMFGIGYKGGMMAEMSRDVAFTSDQTYLAFRRRLALKTMLPAAFSVLFTSATI